jgi:hypothetical protein
MRLFDGISSGAVTVAFRSWKRPTVKAGGTLITPVGQLAIDRVEIVDPSTITDADAVLAGAASALDVRRALRPGDDRAVYRIDFHLAGDDPRAALRVETGLSDDEWAALERKLDAMDARSAEGPWTAATLSEIDARPGVVSTVLAEAVGLPRPEFKLRVRRLKALGLTESLGTGYRISPRGEALMKRRG